MVKTNGKTKIKDQEIVEEYAIDPELIDPQYNQVRRPLLPYGIVVNDNPAGILIPVDQMEKAGWLAMPNDEELHTASLTENVTGLLISKARMLVLGYMPEYIRYKSDVEDVAGTVVGLYEDYKSGLDKKTMEVCSEHALVFLDSHNRPLHATPLVVRFKNVALWSFKTAREEYYRLLEKTFADYCETKFSGKNDKWRSLGILECKFKAVKEGEGKNKHDCCKTVEYTKPTVDNIPRLFLGTAQMKNKVWDLHDGIAGFNEAPALPGSTEVQSLPPALNNSKAKEPRKVEAEVIEDDFDEEVDELDDIDFEDDDEF
ncbi:MAG: hypothetical protein NVSMB70_14960 [Chamaesiphon sp.]